MNMDFDNLRIQQLAVSQHLAANIYKEVFPRFLQRHKGACKEANVELDEAAALEAIRMDIEHDVSLAFQGYADWIAASIWQDTRPMPSQSLPRKAYTGAPVALIAEQYALNSDIVELLVEHINSQEYLNVPPLGALATSEIRVDVPMLTTWASSFDW